MQVPWPAGAGAHRKLAGHVRFGAGRERGDLFMTRTLPRYRTHSVKAIAQTIERIAGDTPNPLHPRLFEGVGNHCRHSVFHAYLRRECRGSTVLGGRLVIG